VAPADRSPGSDDLSDRVGEKQRALRQQAVADLLHGRGKVVRRGPSTVVKVGVSRTARAVNADGAPTAAATREDQYVELSREKTDKIFVILAEFGNQRDPSYPDQDTDPTTPGPTTFDGPVHNSIPAPERSVDTSTVWQSDYSRRHYQDLYFGSGDSPGSGGRTESVRQYFERQSSGRYSVDGYVSDWVKVPYNEARYGRSDGYPCRSNVCSNTWDLVRDGVNQWVADQQAAGRSTAQIRQQLQQYDTWDRNDYDGDGNFNEPDGYIDHFQIVHAGGDQADGDPQQGEDAIWSHRWKAYQGTSTGPSYNRDGGTQIGSTGIWVADYTIQPENGGMSVFAHEFTHDLGLPDLYDTSGPPTDRENNVGWWSLMSQSRQSAPADLAIGTRASDLGAWDKLQLGWLDYEAVLPEQDRRIVLGPHEYNSAKAQAAVVALPKKEVTSDLVAPFAGARSWWSGTGDDRNATMTRQVTLGAGTSALTMQARCNIEDCGPDPCDYAYVEVDNGSGWAAIPGSITKATEGNGIDGTQATWIPATFDLSAYAGRTIRIRVRYATDGAAQGNDADLTPGIFLDDVKVVTAGSTLFTSGAEATPEGWTLDGFASVGARQTVAYDNFYIASNRAYVSFDRYLRSGPYNFGWADTRPDFVEHFPYQNGLLVSYWDTSQADNNTSEHPGSGLVLPVDAHPRPLVRVDGALWRPRVGSYDAPFGLEKADSFTLHVNGRPSYVRGQAAQPLFADNRSYFDPAQPTAGVKLSPENRTNIRVLSQDGTSRRIRVWKRCLRGGTGSGGGWAVDRARVRSPRTPRDRRGCVVACG
jgi:immune inhibitor A